MPRDVSFCSAVAPSFSRSGGVEPTQKISELDVTDSESGAGATSDPGELDVVVNNAGFEVQVAMSWSTTSSTVGSTRTCAVRCG